jgi:mRNA-degrading endonuclease YafQ of YafQ-DinJ toxin-antitoxin module
MKALRISSAFKRDLKRITKRHYDRSLLDAVVDVLRAGEQLATARRDHPLLKASGKVVVNATSSPTGS